MNRVVWLVGALLWAGSGPQQISESGKGAYEASLAIAGDKVGVAWYDTRDGHAEIYFRLLTSAGGEAGPERRLTSGNDLAYEPDLAAVDDRFAVAWYEKNPATGRLGAWLGLFTAEGSRVWAHRLSVPEHDGRNPVVRFAAGQIFCAWLEGPYDADPAVWARWYGADGRPLTTPRRVAPAGRTTWNLNAAADGRGRMWVAFDATAGTQTDELFLARVDRTTSEVRRLTGDDGVPSKYPDLAFQGGRVAMTWFDERDGNEEIYLLVAPEDGIGASVERQGRRVTYTDGESIGAYVAWNGDRVGLAWCDNTVGQHEIYFELFDARGQPVDALKRVTTTPAESLIPAIRGLADGFALVWNEFRPAPGGAHDHDGRSEIWFTRIAH